MLSATLEPPKFGWASGSSAAGCDCPSLTMDAGERRTPVRGGLNGLANMRARLEKLGGRFEIASQPGRGTTVRFYLPLN